MGSSSHCANCVSAWPWHTKMPKAISLVPKSYPPFSGRFTPPLLTALLHDALSKEGKELSAPSRQVSITRFVYPLAEHMPSEYARQPAVGSKSLAVVDFQA